MHYKFELMPLGYDFNALEPYIDALTMKLHHDRHLKTYVDNLNAALKDYPEYQIWSLERLIRFSAWLPKEIRTTVRDNAGGVYNHDFFFRNMTAARTSLSPALSAKISEVFGSFDGFKAEFKKAALSVFGSGYAWLGADERDELRIITTPNQETPLTSSLRPIIGIDVWEHAYYLKHYNKRADYIDDWFNVVNLMEASNNFGCNETMDN